MHAVTIDRGAKQRIAGAGTTTSTEALKPVLAPCAAVRNAGGAESASKRVNMPMHAVTVYAFASCMGPIHVTCSLRCCSSTFRQARSRHSPAGHA